MKSDFWIIIIMNSLKGMRNLRVERRTVTVLIVGGLFFVCAFIFFAYGYFSLLREHSQQQDEVQKLQREIAVLEEKLKFPPQGTTSDQPLPPSLAINDLKITPRPNHKGFSISFRINNESPQESPISGTLVMVAKNETLKTPIYRVVPEMELNKGVPQQPEKGSPFELKRQKFVEAYFDSLPHEVFKTLVIYFYAQDRSLILQKSFEIPEG